MVCADILAGLFALLAPLALLMFVPPVAVALLTVVPPPAAAANGRRMMKKWKGQRRYAKGRFEKIDQMRCNRRGQKVMEGEIKS